MTPAHKVLTSSSEDTRGFPTTKSSPHQKASGLRAQAAMSLGGTADKTRSVQLGMFIISESSVVTETRRDHTGPSLSNMRHPDQIDPAGSPKTCASQACATRIDPNIISTMIPSHLFHPHPRLL